MTWPIVVRLAVVLALIAGGSMSIACNQDQQRSSTEKKASPDEIIAALTAAGMKVEKKGTVGGPRVELGVELAVDGAAVYAKRYPEADLARDTAQTWPHGVAVGFWAFDSIDEPTAQKLRQALQKNP